MKTLSLDETALYGVIKTIELSLEHDIQFEHLCNLKSERCYAMLTYSVHALPRYQSNALSTVIFHVSIFNCRLISPFLSLNTTSPPQDPFIILQLIL